MKTDFQYAHLPHYLSLGAGVQSSTLALMYSLGELEPMPKAAIFADTQDEPASVYKWLDWLETQLAFPLTRVTAGKLSELALTTRTSARGRVYPIASIPFHVLNARGDRSIVTHRNCTKKFKIDPIRQELRKAAGIKRGETTPQIVSCIGISLDEVQRIKPSRDKWCVSRWPLIEMRWTRRKCLDWIESKGFPQPPKSACVFCPYKDAHEFRNMQEGEGEDFQAAVEFEKKFNAQMSNGGKNKNTYYVYRSCKPLDQIDFRSDVEKGQGLLWNDECEGMCGV